MLAAAMMTELEGVEAASISMRSVLGDVTRARFDDGAARQAAASSATVETWRLRALVKDGRLEAFRAWADAQGAGWFDFLAGGAAGDKLFQGRFVGGAGRVSYQQVAPGAGAARWAAEMEIERRPIWAPKGNLRLWPWYAPIKSDLTLGATLQAERAGLQGAGLARQAAREDAAWRTWRLTAVVDDERLFEFLDWLRRNRMGWIWLPAADGAAWRARLAGGYGGVALRQVGTRAGRPRWEASLTLEMPAPVEVKANVGRSIFDPAVALGDASRVYWRERLEFDHQVMPGGTQWRLIAGGDLVPRLGGDEGGQLSVVPLPGKFVVGGGATYLSTIELRTSGRFRLRLIGPGHTSGQLQGPHLTTAARRGLAFIMAWGGHVARVVIDDSDEDEPYTYDTHHRATGLGVPFRPTVAARRDGPMDVAVVWNAPGAGDTGFLADFCTTRGGAAAP